MHSKMVTKFRALVGALLAVAAATSASAGIKYWNNPAFKAFDVGDYVQDGLILNYDGIRNVGADAEHDSTATTWKNLGSTGNKHDMIRHSLVDGKPVANSAAKGSWSSNAFLFDKSSIFHLRDSIGFTVGTKYTLQTLVDATADEQSGIGYLMCPSIEPNGNHWLRFAIAVRSDAYTYGGVSVAKSMYHMAYDNAGDTRVALSGTSFSYATVMLDYNLSIIFSGMEAVWSGTPATGFMSSDTTSPKSRTYEKGFSIGGQWPATQYFKGALKYYRHYDRILTNEELAWNRIVDEARYFGVKSSSLPVTNVVVASNIPIVCGDEPNGCYALDGEGYTFAAPASKVVKGRTYTLDGYTIEVWNGNAWGGVTTYNGKTTYTAKNSELIRLTWRWTPGNGLVAYDVEDYVQDGLILNYDGIRNAGADVPHDSAATTWVNLGSTGNKHDMIRHSLVDGKPVANSAAKGSWASNAFLFDKSSIFHLRDSIGFTVGTKYTLQTLVDATADEQAGIGYLLCPSVQPNNNHWMRFSIGIRNSAYTYGGVSVAKSMYHMAADNAGFSRVALPGTSFSYATVMLDWNQSIIFSGTEAVWSGTPATGYMTDSSTSPKARTYEKGFSLGGQWNITECFKGALKCYRHYDRVLTNDELAWNRIVDDARFFAEPMVFVASTRADVQANERDGSYGVVGSYTFTAPAQVTAKNGITYAPAGYAIQVWDSANGVWGAASEHSGASYAYTTAAGKVRLLWRWKAVRGARSAASYDVTDYVAGGLVFHLDGIRNAGVSVAHDSAAKVWANLGAAGTAHNAVLSNEVDACGYWKSSGYDFDGKCRFVAKMPYSTTYTLQFLSDAVQNEQSSPDNATIYFICGDADTRFAYATYGQYLYPRVQKKGNDPELRMEIDKAKSVGYVTSIQDQIGKSVSVFSGIYAPVSGGNIKTYGSMLTDTSFSNVCIGGWNWNANNNLRGGINYVRYYDRVLSATELAWNRQVDEARFFGNLASTNVVVVAGGGEQAETGAYVVEGTWDFTAKTMVNARGETVDVARYTTEVLVDGKWTGKTFHKGNIYTYTVGQSPATVRITWREASTGLMLFVR